MQNNQWRGHTLDELRYRRAHAAAHRQVQRTMLTQQVGDFRRGNPITRRWNSLRDIFSAIGYVNTTVMAWQLGRRIWGLFRTIRHR